MQFFSRPEWRHVKKAYGLEEDWFVKISMDPTRMYDAVADGQVDLIVAYSSDGRTGRLATLRDPEQALPPYSALLLVSPKAAANEQLVSALRPLVGAIPQEAMVDANAWVDRDKHSAAWAAAQLRRQAGLGRAKTPRDPKSVSYSKHDVPAGSLGRRSELFGRPAVIPEIDSDGVDDRSSVENLVTHRLTGKRIGGHDR
jgi:hypothetical protein